MRLLSLSRRWFGFDSARASARPKRQFKPRLEWLEDRCVPATSAFYSMPTTLAGNQGTIVTVPLSIEHLSDASGDQGLASAKAVLTYDPTVFTIANSDVTAGTLLTSAPPSGTWTFTVDTATPGEVDITATTSAASANITSATGGVLANLAFHIKGVAPTGNSTIHVVVPPEMSPNGLSGTAVPASGPNSGTGVGYTLNPADQQDGVVNIQNFQPVTTLSIPTGLTGAAGDTVTIPVNISNPDPNGSAGMISADAVILYDPNLLSVAPSGAVSAGSVIPATGWNVSYTVDTSGANLVDPTKAALALHLINTDNTPLTTTAPGSLWRVDFMLAVGGSGTTTFNLVPSASVGGNFVATSVTGANKTYQLSPAPTNGTDTIDGSITIQNPPVVAAPTVVPTSTSEGASPTFTVTGTFTDPGGAAEQPFTAVVNWGDGSSDTATVTGAGNPFVYSFMGNHTYAQSGSYDVTVSVTNMDGAKGTSSATAVTVNNVAPTVGTPTVTPTTTDEGAATTFDVSGTFTDPAGADDAPFTATVNWGDNTTSTATVSGSDNPFSYAFNGLHTYAQSGTYFVTVSVTDTDGDTGTSAATSVTVNNVAPTVNAPTVTPSTATAQASTTFDVTGTLTDSAGAGDAPFTATINWGDQSTDTATVSGTSNPFSYAFHGTHTYATAGHYDVTVSVTDKDGDTGVSPATSITVNPPPFVYDAVNRVLTVTGNQFLFSQQTTQDVTGLHTTYSFTIDGMTQTYNETQLTHVVVNGIGANPSAVLLTGDTYMGTDGARHETTEFVDLGPGSDGEILKYNTLGMISSFLEYHNFPASYGYGGTADAGQLVGAGSALNTFVSAGTYSYITSPGQFHLVSGTAYVYGYAMTAGDVAYHYDGSGPSTFVVSGTSYSVMEGNDNGRFFYNEAVGFRFNHGIAQHAGQDTAIFYDSAGNDVFAGFTSFSYMYADDAAGNLSEYDTASNFAAVYAYSFVGGTDYAYVYDGNVNHVSGFRRLV